MQRRNYLAFMGATAFLAACGGGESDDSTGPSEPRLVQDAPGRIQGLGSFGGSVQVSEFTLPNGITSRSPYINMYVDLPGYYPISDYSDLSARFNALKYEAKAEPDVLIGMGSPVILRIPLTNSTASAINVPFPAGLIVENVGGVYQPGVLVCDSMYSVAANSTEIVALLMLCGDLKRLAPPISAPYTLAGVSRSSTLNELLTLLKGKAIAIEKWDSKKMRDWWYVQHRLQLVLFSLTNSSIGLSVDDRSWISTLPI